MTLIVRRPVLSVGQGTPRALWVGILCLLLSTVFMPRAVVAQRRSEAVFHPPSIRWLRVDPHHPTVLFVGGSFACPMACSDWVMQSTNGGRSWHDVRTALGLVSNREITTVAPLIITPDGRHLYIGAEVLGGGAHNDGFGLIWSADGGLHWHNDSYNQDGYGYRAFAVSPLASTRLYAMSNEPVTEACSRRVEAPLTHVIRSDDGGRTWCTGADLLKLAYPDDSYDPFHSDLAHFIPSVQHRATVFANVLNVRYGAHNLDASHLVFRSDDAGATWVVVPPTRDGAPLQTFEIDTDSAAYRGLIGRSHDPGLPADRRYISYDEGRSWVRTTCPGAVQATCPVAIVKNVFGDGAFYAFVGDGIYRFTVRQAIPTQVRTSGSLPVPTSRIISVAGGEHDGDPVYLLATGQSGRVEGVLYRTRDQGNSWQQIGQAAFSALTSLDITLP